MSSRSAAVGAAEVVASRALFLNKGFGSLDAGVLEEELGIRPLDSGLSDHPVLDREGHPAGDQVGGDR